MLFIALPVHIEGELDEGSKTLLTCAQLILGALALSNVARQAKKPTSALFELANPNLHREGRAVLAPVAGLEGNRFLSDDALLEAPD